MEPFVPLLSCYKVTDGHEKSRVEWTYICFPLKINLCIREQRYTYRQVMCTVAIQNKHPKTKNELTSAGEVGFPPSPLPSPLFSPPTPDTPQYNTWLCHSVWHWPYLWALCQCQSVWNRTMDSNPTTQNRQWCTLSCSKQCIYQDACEPSQLTIYLYTLE